MPIEKTDLVIIGAGAAGLTAALSAAILGLKVVVVEKAAVIGGTAAISAGSVWVPNTHHAPPGSDSFDNALLFLNSTVGNYAAEPVRRAFLNHGPEMVKFLEQNSPVQFRAYVYHPDYLADAPGATTAGRVIEPVPFDARQLGKQFHKLRPPLPEFTLFGGMMVDRIDIGHLLNLRRSWQSLRHAGKLLLRYASDRLRFNRGTRLVMGNALVGRLYLSLLQHNVPIWTECQVERLVSQNDRINGVVVHHQGKQIQLLAARGVVLAAGGFSHHPELRQQLLPKPTPDYSVVPSDNSGDGIDLGTHAGARLGQGHANNSFWAPVSVRQRRDGSTAVFPHFVLDRGKPGIIAVNIMGRRFVNEATSYQLFSQALYAMYEATPEQQLVSCFLICDYAFIKKYGLGMVRPGGFGLQNFIKQGYITSAATLAELAVKLAIDANGLQESVTQNNQYAESGIDEDFSKGNNAYHRHLGDTSHSPNPCLGPIQQPPFYALTIYPGDIGASCGLLTNNHAQVLDENDNAIPGLYACGNDMDSIMGGIYPAPGITLGPALTFAYIAAQHAATCKSSMT